MDLAKKVLAFFLTMTVIIGVSLGAAVHEVGDSAGWTVMMMGNVDYNKWAASKTFHVGDDILFQYNNQFHNLKQVSLQDFQSCNTASPIATYTTGSDSITLKKPGNYYFLCGFPSHCEAGQKLGIMVSNNPAASLRPSASPRSALHDASSSPSSGPSSSSQHLPSPYENNDASLHAFSFKLWSALVSLVIIVIGFRH